MPSWGTAVSAFQTEMGNRDGTNNDLNSDWWVWTHWNVENKTARVSNDLPEDGPNMYDLYETDFDNAKSLGLNAFQLSIEWSRIFPDDSGVPNSKEVEHYHFEWGLGYSKKFGLFSFDPVTKARTMRPSAEVYEEIISSGRIE
jgi:beta-glucosidase/6-phospho-beta-glucosidase/beta-galactosidase